jgi:1-deoxy-D-xylulose-5-phosphate synthase
LAPESDDFETIPLFEPEVARQGTSCAIIAAGDAFVNAEAACAVLAESGMAPELINARFIKPLSEPFYRDLFARHKRIITVENNALAGGFGAGLMELASSLDATGAPAFLRLGYPDKFIPHGAMKKLLQDLELDAAAIARRVKEFITV